DRPASTAPGRSPRARRGATHRGAPVRDGPSPARTGRDLMGRQGGLGGPQPPCVGSPDVDLLEYQGKQFFARFGIPVSDGRAVTTVEDAVAAAGAVGYPVVVKAQVHVGGRGKAGGVKLAADADECREHAGNILGLDIKGHVVRTVWIEHASDIAEEY